MCARIPSCLIFISWPLMWVWLRSTHVGVSPLCIVYAISLHSIAYARLYVRALCMPCYLVHRVCHFIALCMLGCILVAFHVYHAYCIVLGIGVSPSTGNEGRFVLRVTERVSIPSHQHSGLSMMELGLVVFICAFILYWVAQFDSSAIMHWDAWLEARGSRTALPKE